MASVKAADNALLQQAMSHYQQQQWQAARSVTEQMLTINADDFNALHLQALVEVELRQINKALSLYQQALSIHSGYAQLHCNYGIALSQAGKQSEAIESYENAILLKPDYAEAYNNLGNALVQDVQFAAAIEAYQNAIRIKPDYPQVYNNLGSILKDCGLLDEAIESFHKALSYRPDYPLAQSNLLFTLHYHPGVSQQQLFDAHLAWQQQYADKIKPTGIEIDNGSKKVLKIGLLSSAFHCHPALWLSIAAFEQLKRDKFQLYIYSYQNTADDFTLRLRSLCRQWCDISAVNDSQAAAKIREDKIDILVDMSGHSLGRLLICAHRAAPVQIKWVGGLFNTTGIKEMDWLLADNIEIPPGEEHWYVEKIYRLPKSYICYKPPDYDLPVAPLPALQKSNFTFGCFNNPAKVNDEIIRIWAKVLNGTADSRLFLKGKAYAEEKTQKRIRQQFIQWGVNGDRIIFAKHEPHQRLLAAYHEVDIALDPWPYSGGLTTLEALWMGVPVVTLPGPTFAGRHAASHLTHAGLSDWIVDDADKYIEKCLYWYENRVQLSDLRKSLRQRLLDSSICDAAGFSRDFEIALRNMWEFTTKNQHNT